MNQYPIEDRAEIEFKEGYREGRIDCKNEVIKLLKDNIIEISGPHGTGREYIDIDILKKIEKL